MSISVLLADDHKMMRDALRTVLRGESDLQVVGEAEDGTAAVRLAARLAPRVVVMDQSMPGLKGVEATRQITANDPRVKVLVLSACSDAALVRECLEAGAAGCVPKEEAFEELAAAVRAVAAGKVYLSPKLKSGGSAVAPSRGARPGQSGRPW